jgi:hypothetical protein
LGDRRVTSVIVGSRTPEQLEQSLVAADWDLPADLRQRLCDCVPFAHGYPRDWMEGTWGNIAGGEEFPPWEVPRGGDVEQTN